MTDKPKIEKNEYVLTAFPKPCNGPGWSNSPVVAVVATHGTGDLRLVYIQPEHQTADMVVMFHAAAACESTMTKSAECLLRGLR